VVLPSDLPVESNGGFARGPGGDLSMIARPYPSWKKRYIALIFDRMWRQQEEGRERPRH